MFQLLAGCFDREIIPSSEALDWFLTNCWYLLFRYCEGRDFVIDRLRDFFGLNSILRHGIKSSKRVNIRLVSSSLEQIMVVSSMNAFRGGMEHPPPRLAGPALPSVAFTMTSMAITNSIWDIVHPIAIPTSRLIQ
ncbi:hypothetical protein PoB_000840400 [Plakobranchus ocellatus]|uniref:Maturase K n=1 Tax=Plakobranchus ocellatus TaxID=259542 RepID=A0AAV3YFY3_9GAST|nr:hypothetical protein PoB_000840400 [Plakobranchus ocellatus]